MKDINMDTHYTHQKASINYMNYKPLTNPYMTH